VLLRHTNDNASKPGKLLKEDVDRDYDTESSSRLSQDEVCIIEKGKLTALCKINMPGILHATEKDTYIC
jgi:hypothetical protein